jgi:hypothetical protein
MEKIESYYVSEAQEQDKRANKPAYIKSRVKELLLKRDWEYVLSYINNKEITKEEIAMDDYLIIELLEYDIRILITLIEQLKIIPSKRVLEYFARKNREVPNILKHYDISL